MCATYNINVREDSVHTSEGKVTPHLSFCILFNRCNIDISSPIQAHTSISNAHYLKSRSLPPQPTQPTQPPPSSSVRRNTELEEDAKRELILQRMRAISKAVHAQIPGNERHRIVAYTLSLNY